MGKGKKGLSFSIFQYQLLKILASFDNGGANPFADLFRMPGISTVTRIFTSRKTIWHQTLQALHSTLLKGMLVAVNAAVRVC